MGSEGSQQFFPGATNTTIHGGIFSAVHGDMHIHSPDSKRYGLELILAKIAEGAFHNAAERGDSPRCHPHTRTAILEEIMTWIRAPKAYRTFILWLYGPAGAGKTAIAQTIAEECEKIGLLAGSFFFGRTGAGRNDFSRFVATLAYQLSLSIPEIHEPIIATVEKDPAIFSRKLLVQMQKLIVAPLASFTGPIREGPQIVVVDGVDEGGPDGKAQAELLNALGAAVSELQHIPIIFFVVSRPEYDIRLAFNTNLSSLTKSLVLDDKYNPDADIKYYLKHEFQVIRNKQLALGTPLPSSWPAEYDVYRLVKKSSGQFIFASTVIKFVDSRRSPAKCLDIILGLSHPGKETPFAQLDALYRFILSSVDDREKVLEALILIILADGYNSYKPRVDLADEFLGCEARRVLVDMHALVFVPPPTAPKAVLRIYHASLYDFLMDRSRSQDFFVGVNEGHLMISQRWLEMITNYSDSKRSEEYSLSFQIDAFVYHCRKLTDGELGDCLASFDLKALLEKIKNIKDLYGPSWDTFMATCQKQQANNTRVDFFPRLQNEFRDFILDRVSQYPPSIQLCIPALFVGLATFVTRQHIQKLFLVLLHGVAQTEAEFTQIQDLDTRSLKIRNLRYNVYFRTFFQRRMESEQYASHATLAKEIIKVICPKPGDAKLHIAVEDIEFLLPMVSTGRTTHSLWHVLLESPKDLELAHLLRERALQYRYSKKLNERRRRIALVSLRYVQICGVPYLRHAHPPNTNRCIICKMCCNASVRDDMEDVPPTPELVPNNHSSPYLSLNLESSYSGVAGSLSSDTKFLTQNRSDVPPTNSVDVRSPSGLLTSPGISQEAEVGSSVDTHELDILDQSSFPPIPLEATPTFWASQTGAEAKILGFLLFILFLSVLF